MSAVKADPRDQLELLRVQELDTAIARASHAIRNPPQAKELAQLDPIVTAVRSRRLAASGELDDARAELKRIESDVSVVEARLQRDQDRLQTTSSVKDVTALEAEIQALRARRSDLEDIELGVMERIEEFESAVAAIDAEGAGTEQRIAALQSERADAVTALERDRAAYEADRAALAADIPGDLLALYEKQRARYGVGAARLVGGVSLASNMTLSPSDLATVRTAAPDEVVLCPDSGAVLIRDENS
jgi:predicted  nucleic acid-binding Zn-ribbon protein